MTGDQMAMSDEPVPIFDLAAARSPSLATRRSAAGLLDRICARSGFLLVTGHAVPDAIVEAAWDTTRAFFDLPIDAKRRHARPPGTPWGYHELGSSALAYSSGDLTSAPDYREVFTMSRPAPAADAPPPPECPDEIVGLGPAWLAYFREMERLAGEIMRLFALALDLDEGFFDDKIDRHMTSFQVSNYPHQTAPPTANQLRAGAHSDWGSLTIVRTEDKPGGLEVLDADRGWTAVPFVPGSFVVNIGDLMARWTNDHWVSTVHRVVNPPPGTLDDTRRQSLIFFHQPNEDALIECIPSCARGRDPLYPAITSGAYLAAKIAQSYHLPDADG